MLPGSNRRIHYVHHNSGMVSADTANQFGELVADVTIKELLHYTEKPQTFEFVAVSGNNSNAKACRKPSKTQKDNSLGIALSRGKGKQGKPGSTSYNAQINKVKAARSQKSEPLVKEEGEMSDTEEVYEQFKEVKWMEWCEDVMADEKKTLTRLQRFLDTNLNIPFAGPPLNTPSLQKYKRG